MATVVIAIATTFTYCEMHASGEDTRKLANAAQEQASATMAASRSYIFVTATGGYTIANWTFNKGLIAVRLHLTNYGAAPAIIKHVGCVLEWGTPEGPLPDAISVAGRDPSHLVSGLQPEAVIGAKEIHDVVCTDGWPINDNTDHSVSRRREAINMGRPIWVVALVNYEDASGNPHSTPVCAMNYGGVDLIAGGGIGCSARRWRVDLLNFAAYGKWRSVNQKNQSPQYPT